MEKSPKSRLGRGLDAILSSSATDITSKSSPSTPEVPVTGAIAEIPVAAIGTNPFQPRTEFEEQALAELARSIEEHGLIQPVTVRKLGYDKYQLISGERRFRASQVVGLKTIPAYVRIANDQAMLEMALVENIQRRDLNPIEVAVSFKRLVQECDLTQEALSDKVGKDRSTVANFLRLLKLPDAVQAALKNQSITMGHAKAIMSLDDAKAISALCNRVIGEGLSVRQTEEIVRGKKTLAKEPVAGKKGGELTIQEEKLQSDLTDLLNTDIRIRKSANGRGSISIPFKSTQDLRRIAELIRK